LVAFAPDGNDETCAKKLTAIVRKLLRDPEARNRMSTTGRRLVDGQGAFRIARKMANWGISLRNATMSDAPSLLAWRNDPEVRSVAFQSDVMTEETFRIWFERQLENQESRLWIVESRRGDAIGKVQLDFENPQQAVIEVALDHTRRGKGLGRAVIQQACQLAFDENPLMDSVVARICPGNVASERAFRSVGFVQSQPTMINGKLAFQFVLWRGVQSQAKRSAA